MKNQKLRAVRHIVNTQIASQPWGQDARAKIGSHLIELIIQTAFIQPPASRLAEGRPAFIHTLKTVTKETKTSTRRYGVIQCDPLVRKGLERTARHMVIPYMPMLVPPVIKWTGSSGTFTRTMLISDVVHIHASTLEPLRLWHLSGILEFEEGRPRGQSGLQWLKIHVDKLSHEGRIAFTENHVDDI